MNVDPSSESKAGAVIAGVTLSNAGKELYPESHLTKRDLAQYYESVAACMLPHLRGRPLSLLRCPDGWDKTCFFQKHANKGAPALIARIEAPERGGTAMYLTANSLSSLVGLVQWGVIELHPWASRAPRLDRPDRLIFDLDPDESVAWPSIVEAVLSLRGLLGELGLTGFLKTTGGKGLHVVVPIRASLDWESAKAFTRAVAELLQRRFPDRFTAAASKARRKDRIFVDYLRNAQGATAIAPYAMRARRNAPVATPVAWEELASDLRFDHFNVRNVPARLARMRSDPWAAFQGTKQTVTAAMLGRVVHPPRS